MSSPVPPRKVSQLDKNARRTQPSAADALPVVEANAVKMLGSVHNQHQRTRDDHATEIAEDYVEAVAEIIASLGQCRVKDLAERFHVSHVTASRTVGRLQKSGLVITTRHAPIELTVEGIELAKRCQHRHEIVFRFLLALGITPSTAAIDTEGIEHHVSEETLRKMGEFLSSSPTQAPSTSCPK